MSDKKNTPGMVSRRDLLSMVGKAAGGAVMFQAMSSLGFAAESNYRGPIKLQGAPKGATVLILGAGLAGLVAAYEMRQAGYKVKVLEYNNRAGGRAWSIRGGDEIIELGGVKQRCGFDKGLYFNPGPWRIPNSHYGMLDYAKRLKVPLEPFMQVNQNSYIHSTKAYGGKPQRYAEVQADYHGYVAELLSKAVNSNQLDAPLTTEDKERLLESLVSFGGLDKEYRYRSNNNSSGRRGYDVQSGGGLMPRSVPSTPLKLNELLQSRLWSSLADAADHEHQPTLFQPVGGMDRIAQAIYREVAKEVQLNAKVTRIDQNERGVTVTYHDVNGKGENHQVKADWCVCTIPLSILSQIEMTVSSPMQEAINAVPYASSSKVGLQFKRRFWEEDEQIYGGVTHTDLPIGTISYPSTGYGNSGKGVLLGAYNIFSVNSFEFSSMTPQQRIQMALEQGAKIHPQYLKEFDNGVAVAWHKMPFTLGCLGAWTDKTREQHYKNLCQIDGRIVLAGEHASYINGWQEGAVLSSLDAIQRLHALIKSKA